MLYQRFDSLSLSICVCVCVCMYVQCMCIYACMYVCMYIDDDAQGKTVTYYLRQEVGLSSCISKHCNATSKAILCQTTRWKDMLITLREVGHQCGYKTHRVLGRSDKTNVKPQKERGAIKGTRRNCEQVMGGVWLLQSGLGAHTKKPPIWESFGQKQPQGQNAAGQNINPNVMQTMDMINPKGGWERGIIIIIIIITIIIEINK